MRSPRYYVRKHDYVSGPPIPSDEPCIVIRAQDVLALDMVDDYLSRYCALDTSQVKVVSELLDHRTAIVEWQATHPTKVADR